LTVNQSTLIFLAEVPEAQSILPIKNLKLGVFEKLNLAFSVCSGAISCLLLRSQESVWRRSLRGTTNNGLEISKELKRRSRAIGRTQMNNRSGEQRFASWFDISEDWITGKRYLSSEK
jgi:hypothetical protein